MTINNLVNMAFNSEKLTKKHIQSLIESYISDEPEWLDDNELSFLLANVYKYFMPAIPKIAKNKFQWLQKSVSSDKTRHYIKAVYCDGEYLISTDGHTLFYAENIENLPIGYVSETGIPIDFEGEFPKNWRRVFSDNYKNHNNIKDISSLKIEKIEELYVYAFPCGAYFNKSYVDKALNGKKSFTYGYDDPSKPIEIKDLEFGNAVIMPIRMK